MIRILHVLGGLGLGGAESRIMDLYRHMDRDRVQFDFLVHMDASAYARAIADGVEPATLRKPQYYDEEILSLGGHIYALPRYRVYNASQYKKAINRFFEDHHDYNVVQGHMTSTASYYLPIAAQYRDAGAGAAVGQAMVTVAHTRNAGVDAGIKGMVVRTLRKSLPQKADFLFACSHLAGDETFGGAPYTYIPNTIDTGKFVYDPADAETVRSEFDIPDDAILIGNVARFSPQKNQAFLLKAFAGMKTRRDARSDAADGRTDSAEGCDIRLMFCGDGELRAECESLAESLGISDSVVFAGNRGDIWKYYSAMDIFAFPSIYEGLPGVVVEAQASGCRCVISDTITTDVMITDTAQMCPIDGGCEVWSELLDDTVRQLLDVRGKVDRRDHARVVRDAGFDVTAQAQAMMSFYLDPCAETLPAQPGED